MKEEPSDLRKRAAGEFRLYASQLTENRVREVDGEIQVYFPKAGTWQNSTGKLCSEWPWTPRSELERHGPEKAASRAALRKAAEKAGKR